MIYYQTLDNMDTSDNYIAYITGMSIIGLVIGHMTTVEIHSRSGLGDPLVSQSPKEF